MDALLGALLSQQVRAKAGMRTKPSVVIIDFQSVKTTQKGQRGYGAGKKIKGGKRHIAIKNTMELPLTVAVHSAGIQDRAGARALLIRLFLRFECLKTIFAMAATQAA